MVKFLLTIFVIFLLFRSYGKFSDRNVTVSYNEHGRKVVRVECPADEGYKCRLTVGQYCEKSGYKALDGKQVGDELVLVVVCGESRNVFQTFIESS